MTNVLAGTIDVEFVENITGYAWLGNMFHDEDAAANGITATVIGTNIVEFINLIDPDFGTPGDAWNWNSLPAGVTTTDPFNGNIP